MGLLHERGQALIIGAPGQSDIDNNSGLTDAASDLKRFMCNGVS